ncbi:MAG: hypothetical protein HKN44_00630 [Ilumatobacter sp.]|nr:hypothetical protein [Ilumatobacter sp.]
MARFSRGGVKVVPTTPAPAALGARILAAIDDGVEQRWGPALRRAAAVEGDTVEARVDAVTSGFRQELGVAGAAAGGTSAIPGVGVATASAAFAVELAWSTVRLTDLVLTIAALHGHRDATIDERRLWVLTILTFGDGATSMLTRLASDLGATVGSQAAGRVPAETVRQLNKALGAKVVTRYGTRRGAIAVGRAIPFGIGAALGYGLNSYTVKATARHANVFFADIPVREESIPTTATDLG